MTARLALLEATLAHARRAPLYADKLGAAPRALGSLAELHDLPLTTKAELRDAQPFGALAVPLDDVIEVHTSSGTTNTPVPSFFTRDDLAVGSAAIAEAWRAFGIDRGSRVQFAMAYGLFSGAQLNTYALQHLGAFVLPAGIQSTYRHVQLLADYRIDTMVATPGYYLHLADFLDERDVPRASLALTRGIAAGEVYAEEVRGAIERRLGIRVFDHYGLCEVNTGIAYECEHRTGLHVLDDYVIAEVVDPVTGAPVADGVEGELVLTSLRKQASPVIRYRTGDVTRLRTDPCPCGRATARIDRIRRRVDDLLFIKGIKVDPHELKAMVLAAAGDRIAADVQLVVHARDAAHGPRVLVALKRPGDADLLAELQHLLRERIGLRFCVENVDASYFDRETRMKLKVVEYVA